VEKRYSSTLSLTSAVDKSEWSTTRPGRFITGKRRLLFIVQEAEWGTVSVWTVMENLAPARFRFPDRISLQSRYTDYTVNILILKCESL